MLGECGWSEQRQRGRKLRRISLHLFFVVLLLRVVLSGARFQLASAWEQRRRRWATRVSFAVTRITPGQTLRQNGNTARANELFKPSAANSARRIWCQQCGPQLRLEERRRLRRNIGSDGTTCSMQRDRYAIAGKRGDDSCLIADAVEPILRCAADVTIRDMGDGDRLGEQRLRAGKPHREVWTVLLHLREEVLPAITHTCEIAAVAPRSRGLQCRLQPAGCHHSLLDRASAQRRAQAQRPAREPGENTS